ncbi:hypothetical protein BYT27DRAFT_7183739 [Phlegmacium glaucopus]|nr:hypothetical protein BYT27DRAFT_7183739 [Phlegmacium glaucopus]
MARFSQLSVELHCEILKHVFHYSRRPSNCYGWPQNVPPDMQWIEKPRTPSSFPFNAALTCSLWRDILAGIPECWTRMVFDVTADPNPIINAFEWSKSLRRIELLVYTNANDHADISKDRELNRVKAIVDALEPHIHRCSSITSDVMYGSSLPSSLFFFSQSAPNLYELELKFRVDEAEIENDGHDILTFRIPNPNLATSFPLLDRISMDGRAFMELCSLDGADEWFKNLKTSYNLSLRIAKFRFNEEDGISVWKFASCISKIHSLSDFHFQNLSVAYSNEHEPDHGKACRIYFKLNDFHFDNVSKDFLSEFFACATCYGERTIFSRCAIPTISQPFYCLNLELNNIIAHKEIKNGAWESSLHRILVGWEGSRLTVRSCPSFDDDLIQWLCNKVDYTPFQMLPSNSFDTNSIAYHIPYREISLKAFPAESIQKLAIYDCENYSFEHLRKLFEVRKEASPQEEIDGPDLDYEGGEPSKAEIIQLTLGGAHPKLMKGDIEWIQTGNLWTICRDGSEMTFLGDDGQVFRQHPLVGHLPFEGITHLGSHSPSTIVTP